MKDPRKLLVLVWLLLICFFSLCIAGVISVYAQEPPQKKEVPCYPAEVNWMLDSIPVRSFGCVTARNDTLIIISHFLNGEPKNIGIVTRDRVISVTLYTNHRPS